MEKLWKIVTLIIVVYTAKTRLQTLTISPSSNPLSVLKGQTVTLSVTADADMSQFQWHHKGALKKTDTSNQTRSSFTITTASLSDGGEYKCTGTLVNGSVVSATKTIVIHYLSEVTITPTYRPYILSIYQSNIQLTCSVTGNPSPSIKWTKGTSSSALNTSANYVIQTVQKSTAGTFKCTANNNAGTKTKEVEIQVQYGPEISYVANQKMEEGHDLLMKCSVNASPQPSRIWWSREDDSSFIMNGKYLNITNIQRTMSGVYICRAENSIKPSGEGSQVKTANKTVNIDVTYGPGSSVVVDTPGGVKSLTLTENVPTEKIRCSSDCNPSCSHSWSKQGSSSSFSNPLTLTPVSKSKAGVYRCLAQNEVNNNYLYLNVTVLYSPTVTFSVDGGPNKMEGEKANFSCAVDSNPKADIMIKSVENYTFSYTKVHTSSLNVLIDKVDCLDSGLYRCSANNSIGNVTSEVMNLFVRCKPRLDHRVYRTEQNFEEAVGNGENINITIDLIAYPKPDIRWIFRNEEGKYVQLSETKFPKINISAVSQLMTHRITFTLTKVRNLDYGEYSAIVRNGIGSTVVTYKILRKSADSENVAAILGGVFGSILILVILCIVIVIIMRKRGIDVKDCGLFKNRKESESGDKNDPEYANQRFNQLENVQNDSEQEVAKTSVKANYETTIPTSGDEHPYATTVTQNNTESNCTNMEAAANTLNSGEGIYANLKSKEQNIPLEQQDSNKVLYENTELVKKPKINRKRKDK